MDFVRDARVPVPETATGDVPVKAPPGLPKSAPGNPVARLLPLAMLVACGGMMAVYFTSGSAAPRNPMFMFFPVMMVMSVLGSVAYGARGGVGRSAEIDDNRRNYLRYLDSLDEDLRATTDGQQQSQHRSHPEPGSLWAFAGSRRRWERRSGHPDFCRVRIGMGAQALRTPLIAPELGPAEELDPVTTSAMHRLIGLRSVVDDLPITLPLEKFAVVTIEGDLDRARALVRALVCQLAVWHSPHQVAIAAVAGPVEQQEWEWLKWLPHHQYSHLPDRAPGALAGGPPHAAVILDGAPSIVGAVPAGTTVIEIGAATTEVGNRLCVHVDADGLTLRGDGGETRGRSDSMSLVQAQVCARRLARHRLSEASESHRAAARGWFDLMGVADPHGFDAERRWTARRGQRLAPVPIGVSEDGSPVVIDINEAAHGGIGPHGLCVGATGSGKSEFLRTLVLGMVAAHPPDALNLVLVDFKGGATFVGFEQARHVAAVITNLADEAHLVTRMNEALAGELHRRQEFLRDAGRFANIEEYRRTQSADPSLPPLPALMVIVDEFSELLSQHPDFAELFVAVGRLGRSLGIHLLLASQRLDEGRLRGLDTHLSYRVCLKTFSASESRAVLGVPDAHHLPSAPGAAFLKTAAGELVRFQTAYVSGPCPRRADPPQTAMPMLFTAAAAHAPRRGPEGGADAVTPTVVEAVLTRVVGRGGAAHPVWLPPLLVPPTLDMLTTAGEGGGLDVPIGLVDSPFDQRRDLLVARLAGAGGNVAVVGAPRSGKSTALRCLILALAEGHGPAEVGFYCLDFGGGALSSLRGMPHVGSVAGRQEIDLCRRTVAVLESVLRKREDTFRRTGIDSMAEYRARRSAGDPMAADDPYGDVFLVIDGWATVRQQFEALEAPITAIAAQGLSFGVHVVLTASRWAELRPALKDQIATRVELRLGDPAESEMDRRRARLLANAQPGRGITPDGKDMVIALPRWDAQRTTTGLTEAVAATVGRLRDRWAGQRAPRVELLPTVVCHRDVAAGDRPPTQVVIGLGEQELRPVAVDFGEQPHLLALGETGCGKSSLLRMLCGEIVRSGNAEQVQLEIVDFRRSLLGVVESEHLSGYSASPAALTTRLPKLLGRLEARMPGESVTQQQLRDRSWWSGPEIFLVVDDYDLVAASTGNPLTPLADFLPHAADLGFHVVVARRSGGAARAMFDPVLARMREVGCVGMMMSASPDDGVLLGSVRPSPQPPGRGTLITRNGGEHLVQIGWVEPV